MSSQIPLSVWQWADHTGEDSGFILPGSDDLMAFSSLWNETDVLDETPNLQLKQLPYLLFIRLLFCQTPFVIL